MLLNFHSYTSRILGCERYNSFGILVMMIKSAVYFNFLSIAVIALILLLTVFSGLGFSSSANTSIKGHGLHDNGRFRGIIFAPEYKGDSDEYIKDFELLVTEALAPAGINLIIFDMHWNNFHFTEIPELHQLNSSSSKSIKSVDAKRIADICRENNIRVAVGLNFLTHQDYGQLLKAFPQYQWPGNKKLWNPLIPEVNKVAFRMADELIEAFGAEAFHIGMDEGWGFSAESLPGGNKYSSAELFANAIKQYYDHIVKKKGLEMMMWSDMLEGKHTDALVGDAISMIPKDILLLSWDYECHWRYPVIGKYVEKILPWCPWENEGPQSLIDNGFSILISPWKNPRAAKAMAESAGSIKAEKMRGILYTTWSSNVVSDLREALSEEDSGRVLDPTILGVADTIKETIDLFRD